MLLNDYQPVEFKPAQAGEYRDWIFHRGWLLTGRPRPQGVPEDWQEQALGGRRLFVDPAATLSAAGRLRVIGPIFNLQSVEDTNQQVTEKLAAAWERSREAFQQRLAYCNGCYTVLAATDAGVEVYTDATAMASVFYTVSLETASSHSLLAALAEAEDSTVYQQDVLTKFGSPGRLTPYRGVYSLNPGCRLALGGGLTRYKHTQRQEKRRYKKVRAEFSELLRRAMAAFEHRKQLVMSLTAGSDSRTALAATQGLDGIQLFTYYRSDEVDTDKVDRVIAGRIARGEGLNHELLLLRDRPCPAAYRKVCGFNSHYSHIPGASFHYFEHWGKSDVFHVRSNLSEIGRAFYSYRLPGSEPRPAEKETAIKCYVSDKLKANPRYDEHTRALYDRIFEDYAQSSQLSKVHKSYDYRDIFYWEHRMGVWHSQVVAESSPAFESLSAYNCDRTLELMLMPKYEERRHKKLMLDSIAENWPALLDYPINPADVDE